MNEWRQLDMFPEHLEDFLEKLPRFQKPKNHQQKLFNLQFEYKKGNDAALGEMFAIIYDLTLIVMQKSEKAQIRMMCYSQQETIAFNCADEICNRMQAKRWDLWAITKSFYSYIIDEVNTLVFLRPSTEFFLVDADIDLIMEKKDE